jgi:hypothetical protein
MNFFCPLFVSFCDIALAGGCFVTFYGGDVAMNDRIPSELAILSRAQRALAQAGNLEDVKDLRDKAEAARKYAHSARLSLERQNECAEFKLNCERKAGRLLIELGIGPGRPKGKKRSHHATILSRLGINKSQSSRWQREAQVPENLLQEYLEKARIAGKEITAQGLLRLAQQQRHTARPIREDTDTAKPKRRERHIASPIAESCLCERGDFSAEACELVDELLNQHWLLSNNLLEFCEQEVVRPKLVQRRTVARVLAESRELLVTLLGILSVKTRDRAKRLSN